MSNPKSQLNKMKDYPPELYIEILKDHNFRYGKFSPIQYPMINTKEDKSNDTK